MQGARHDCVACATYHSLGGVSGSRAVTITDRSAHLMIYPGDQLESPVKPGLDSSVPVRGILDLPTWPYRFNGVHASTWEGTSRIGTSVLARGRATVPRNICPVVSIKWILRGTDWLYAYPGWLCRCTLWWGRQVDSRSWAVPVPAHRSPTCRMIRSQDTMIAFLDLGGSWENANHRGTDRGCEQDAACPAINQSLHISTVFRHFKVQTQRDWKLRVQKRAT
jgi:hypothetical protein